MWTDEYRAHFLAKLRAKSQEGLILEGFRAVRESRREALDLVIQVLAERLSQRVET